MPPFISLGGSKLGFFYPNPFLTRYMVTPGISTQPCGQRVSGIGGWEQLKRTANLPRWKLSLYCKQLRLHDAKCTLVTIHRLQQEDCKIPIKLSLGRPCTPTWPNLIVCASLPVNLVNYVKPHDGYMTTCQTDPRQLSWVAPHQTYFLLCPVSPNDQCWAHCCFWYNSTGVASSVSYSNITMYADDNAMYKVISNPNDYR